MKVKTICMLGLLSGLALAVYVAEAAIPPPLPVPGLRLGLSNFFVLLALYLYGRREAALVLLMKTVLGAAAAGTLLSFLYSAAGSLLAFGVMALLRPRMPMGQLWALSAFAAIAHNLGQLFLASLLLGAPGLWWYLPILLLSGILTGLFTGLCARFSLPPLRKALVSAERNE